MNNRSTLLPSLAVMLAAAAWGCWWIPLRAIERHGLSSNLSPVALYGMATLILLAIAALRWRTFRAAALPALVGLGFVYGSQLTIWSYAIIVGDVVRVTLLFYLAPVWGTILAVGFFAERLTALRAAAVLLGVAGAAVMLGGADGFPVPSSLADWLGLWAGLQFALATAWSRRHGAEAGGLISALATFGWAAIAGLAMQLLLATPLPTAVDLAAAAPLILGAALLLVVPSYWLVLWGATRLDPGRVSTLLLFEVAAAAIGATILTDERFGWREFGGCELIVGAGLASSIDQIRQQRIAPVAA